MKVAIVTIGSQGDVLPMATLARALNARGHDVTLMTASPVPDAVDVGNVRILPLADPASCARSVRDKWLLDTRYGLLYVRRYSVPWNSAAYDVLSRLISPDLLILSPDRPNLWADLAVRARFGVPVVRVDIDLPPIPRRTNRQHLLPPGGVQHQLSALCYARWRNMAGAHVGAPGHLTIDRLWRSVRPTAATVALWPSWILGQRAGSYKYSCLGFLPGPRTPAVPPSTYVPASVKRLVVFVAGTDGTTVEWSRQFLETSARLCADLRCEGLLLGYPGEPPGDSAHGPIRVCRFVPLDLLLPHASAIVHHGGIGTAAAAIEHGVPQVVIPRVFAQPDNAEWLRRLGLCAVLNSKSYTPLHAAPVLADVLTNPRWRAVAQEYSERCNSDKNLASACEYFERPAFLAQLKARSPAEAARRRRAQTAKLSLLNAHTA